MAGTFAAKDDPEGPQIHRAIRKYAGQDADGIAGILTLLFRRDRGQK
jgi:hypothetical protein